ncbi:hypothetical protein G0U57_001853, partial [Chelydra serpentina]
MPWPEHASWQQVKPFLFIRTVITPLGLATATGKPIQHLTLVHWLLNALQAPRTVAIVHCRAHTQENTPVTQGNAL